MKLLIPVLLMLISVSSYSQNNRYEEFDKKINSNNSNINDSDIEILKISKQKLKSFLIITRIMAIGFNGIALVSDLVYTGLKNEAEKVEDLIKNTNFEIGQLQNRIDDLNIERGVNRITSQNNKYIDDYISSTRGEIKNNKGIVQSLTDDLSDLTKKKTFYNRLANGTFIVGLIALGGYIYFYNKTEKVVESQNEENRIKVSLLAESIENIQKDYSNEISEFINLDINSTQSLNEAQKNILKLIESSPFLNQLITPEG